MAKSSLGSTIFIYYHYGLFREDCQDCDYEMSKNSRLFVDTSMNGQPKRVINWTQVNETIN